MNYGTAVFNGKKTHIEVLDLGDCEYELDDMAMSTAPCNRIIIASSNDRIARTVDIVVWQLLALGFIPDDSTTTILMDSGNGTVSAIIDNISKIENLFFERDCSTILYNDMEHLWEFPAVIPVSALTFADDGFGDPGILKFDDKWLAQWLDDMGTIALDKTIDGLLSLSVDTLIGNTDLYEVAYRVQNLGKAVEILKHGHDVLSLGMREFPQFYSACGCCCFS